MTKEEYKIMKAKVEPISTNIDWEQRRYEIAKEMFPYSIKQVVDILSEPNTSEEKFLKGNSKSEAAAKMAVGYANILIKELMK